MLKKCQKKYFNQATILPFDQFLYIQQTFAQQPSDQEVNPGVDVVMACRVANKAPQSECIWQKGIV